MVAKGSSTITILPRMRRSQSQPPATSNSVALRSAERASPSLDDEVSFMSLMSSSCFGSAASAIGGPGQVAAEVLAFLVGEVHVLTKEGVAHTLRAEGLPGFAEEVFLNA